MHNPLTMQHFAGGKTSDIMEKDQMMDKIRKRLKKDRAKDTDESFPQGGSFLYPDRSV